MGTNEKLLSAIVGIYCLRFGIQMYLQDIVNRVQSYFLFESKKFGKVDEVYVFMSTKIHDEKDNIFISKLKIRLNTYISKYKYSNKSSIDGIITVIISALTTILIATYTIQSQANKDLIKPIVQDLYNYFTTIYLIVLITYAIEGLVQQLIGSKFEYYLTVKNIIDEVEKNKTI